MPSAQNLPVSVAEVWKKNRSDKLSQWPMSARRNQKWQTKKNSDRKIIQICMKQHLHTERKKLKYEKRDSPLSPYMRKSVNLLPKYFRHQPKKGHCAKNLYKDNQKTIWKKRSYESIRCAFSQPLKQYVFTLQVFLAPYFYHLFLFDPFFCFTWANFFLGVD